MDAAADHAVHQKGSQLSRTTPSRQPTHAALEVSSIVLADV